MKSIRLQQRVTIERPESTQDSESGEMVTTWQALGQDWGQIIHKSGRESRAASAEQAEGVADIYLRFRTDVDATMRVVHDGRIYRIVGPPLPGGKNNREYLKLETSWGVRVN